MKKEEKGKLSENTEVKESMATWGGQGFDG